MTLNPAYDEVYSIQHYVIKFTLLYVVEINFYNHQWHYFNMNLIEISHSRKDSGTEESQSQFHACRNSRLNMVIHCFGT